MKNIKPHDLEATPMGGAMSKSARDIVYSCWHDVVTYCHDVKCENLMFWLFQNDVKFDLMSNNIKMSNDMTLCNLIRD